MMSRPIFARRHTVGSSRRPGRSNPWRPKASFFAAARHLIADRTRREQVVYIRTYGGGELADMLVDEVSPEHQVTATVELATLAGAFKHLSDRCREVLWLRRVQELPQKEVACLLAISEKTVEKHLRVGTHQLALLMHARTGVVTGVRSKRRAVECQPS